MWGTESSLHRGSGQLHEWVTAGYDEARRGFRRNLRTDESLKMGEGCFLLGVTSQDPGYPFAQ